MSRGAREEDHGEEPFRQWLVRKSWYYSKAVAWLLPPAALVVGLRGLLAWQLTAELFFIRFPGGAFPAAATGQ
jgi:hypothetical protein